MLHFPTQCLMPTGTHRYSCLGPLEQVCAGSPSPCTNIPCQSLSMGFLLRARQSSSQPSHPLYSYVVLPGIDLCSEQFQNCSSLETPQTRHLFTAIFVGKISKPPLSPNQVMSNFVFQQNSGCQCNWDPSDQRLSEDSAGRNREVQPSCLARVIPWKHKAIS